MHLLEEMVSCKQIKPTEQMPNNQNNSQQCNKIRLSVLEFNNQPDKQQILKKYLLSLCLRLSKDRVLKHCTSALMSHLQREFKYSNRKCRCNISSSNKSIFNLKKLVR
jgi:hypothetical protein